MPLPLSAGDWIRIQRLKNAVPYGGSIDLVKNTDLSSVVSPQSNPFVPPLLKSRVVGSSKIRREASKWIDYVAARHTDYVNIITQNSGRKLWRTQLCRDTCPNTAVLKTKVIVSNPKNIGLL
jgi:hypothetical protein